MDTRRLILVLIFTFSSFMLWESWQKYNQPKPPAKAAPAETSVPHPTAALQAGAGPTGTPGAVPSPVVNPGDTFTVATDLVNATISAQGGDIVKVELLKYKAHEDKDKTLDLFDRKHKYQAQSGLIGEGLPNHRTQFRLVDGPLKLADGADGSRCASRRRPPMAPILPRY